MNRAPCKADRLAQLAAAIDTLPMAQRAVYLLGVLDDLDYLRIAFRLGLTIDEVERHTADALVAIDRALSEPDTHQKAQE
jgi:DNA-directed RNA polymerase specialized sigma24 family protein